MANQMTPVDRDSLVAAILTAPTLNSGMTPKEKIDQWQAVLLELTKRGGSGKIAYDMQPAR